MTPAKDPEEKNPIGDAIQDHQDLCHDDASVCLPPTIVPSGEVADAQADGDLGQDGGSDDGAVTPEFIVAAEDAEPLMTPLQNHGKENPTPTEDAPKDPQVVCQGTADGLDLPPTTVAIEAEDEIRQDSVVESEVLDAEGTVVQDDTNVVIAPQSSSPDAADGIEDQEVIVSSVEVEEPQVIVGADEGAEAGVDVIPNGADVASDDGSTPPPSIAPSDDTSCGEEDYAATDASFEVDEAEPDNSEAPAGPAPGIFGDGDLLGQRVELNNAGDVAEGGDIARAQNIGAGDEDADRTGDIGAGDAPEEPRVDAGDAPPHVRLVAAFGARVTGAGDGLQSYHQAQGRQGDVGSRQSQQQAQGTRRPAQYLSDDDTPPVKIVKTVNALRGVLRSGFRRVVELQKKTNAEAFEMMVKQFPEDAVIWELSNKSKELVKKAEAEMAEAEITEEAQGNEDAMEGPSSQHDEEKAQEDED